MQKITISFTIEDDESELMDNRADQHGTTVEELLTTAVVKILSNKLDIPLKRVHISQNEYDPCTEGWTETNAISIEEVKVFLGQ